MGGKVGLKGNNYPVPVYRVGRPHAACLLTWSHWSQMVALGGGGEQDEGLLCEIVYSLITFLS